MEREAEAKNTGIYKAIYLTGFLKGVTFISISCFVVDETGYLLKSTLVSGFGTISSCLFVED